MPKRKYEGNEHEAKPNKKQKLNNKQPYYQIVPDMLTDGDIDILHKFMKENDKNTYTTIGDKRQYYFSESYGIYFALNGLTINNKHIKSETSPTTEVEQVIEKLCKTFYNGLEKDGIKLGKKERQLNVFLPIGKINKNTKQNELHLRWHRDTDDANVPVYTLVVLLDKQNWKGGEFLCQYTGKNANVYQKKPFNTPVIELKPEFKNGIILKTMTPDMLWVIYN